MSRMKISSSIQTSSQKTRGLIYSESPFSCCGKLWSSWQRTGLSACCALVGERGTLRDDARAVRRLARQL